MGRTLVRSVVLVLAARALAAQAEPRDSQPAPAPLVKLSGYLQVRETYQSGVGFSASINRARLAADGSLVPSLSYRVQGEFRTGSAGTGRASVSLQDAFIRYAPGTWAVQAGQFKTPFTREFITSLADVETADRSTVVDSLAPKRDIGVMGEMSGRALSMFAGLFNGEGQNVTANRDSTPLGVARVEVRPLPAVALGANTALYFGDSTRIGFDANYQGAVLTLRGEYVWQHRHGLSLPNDKGWYLLAGYFIAPTVQLVGKYERFERPGIAPGEINRAWTGALNLYPFNRNTRAVLEYVSRAVGEPGVRTGQALAQFQVKY